MPKTSGLPPDGAPTETDYVVTYDAEGNATKRVLLSEVRELATDNSTNPYKFSAYRNAAWTSGNGAYGVVVYDTERFDTGNNYDTATGKFTAPVAGYYHFSAVAGASIGVAGDYAGLALLVNGTELGRGTYIRSGFTGNQWVAASSLLSLNAGDYVQVGFWGDGGAGTTGSAQSSFTGHLVSRN